MRWFARLSFFLAGELALWSIVAILGIIQFLFGIELSIFLTWGLGLLSAFAILILWVRLRNKLDE
ncbi:MAG: hypothetical protein COB16_07520 [Rhodobacteraceae bacterium]|nr:MAG: hypothetical protein COB16_07520 [Paracoccaceae bacterium]